MSRTVIDGVVQQFSVSALERADTRGSGCMRKWWYRYVAGVREPENDDMRRGTLMHGHLERYVLTGTLPPTPITQGEGWHDVVNPDGTKSRVASAEYLGAEMAHKVIAGGYVPAPGPDVLVEQALEAWGLTCAGVKMVGKIDYTHARPTNNGVTDVRDMYNPPGTITIGDHKSKNSKKTPAQTTRFLLKPDDLPRSIQMAGYGMGAAKAHPWASHIRLEHVYAFTDKPGPRKVTRLTVIDDIARTWEYAEALGRSIKDAAREPNVEKIDANRFACDRFGPKHLCTHAPYCTGYRNTTSHHTLLFGDQDMSLMNTLANPGPNLGPPATPFNLAAEEQALRAQQAALAAGVPAPQVAAPVVDDATFADAWRAILANGQGQPALGHPAAVVYARLCNTTVAPGAGYAGTGALGQLSIHEPAQLLQLATDFGWRRPAPVAAPIAAPAPAMEVPVVTGAPAFPAPGVFNLAPAPVERAAPSILPPDAPVFVPAPIAQPAPSIMQAPVALGTPAQVAAGTAALATAEAPAKRRGRPRKDGTTAAPPAVIGHLASGEPVTTADVAGGYPLEVFVECRAGGADSLDEYIDGIVAKLVKQFCPPPCIPDLRAAPNDGPLGYGKWKAGLASQVRETPPPAGRYELHTAGDEIRNEVANALRGVCAAAGGIFVDGRR